MTEPKDAGDLTWETPTISGVNAILIPSLTGGDPVFVLPDVDAIRDAVAAEREACAKVAETWADPQIIDPGTNFPDIVTGCYTAADEGQTCSAPVGIATAIRARRTESP